MRSILFATSLVLFALSSLAQPSRAPVPPEFLKGSSLVLEEANVSIPAPSDDWHWERIITQAPPDSVGTFICLNSGTGEYYIVTHLGGEITQLNDDFVRGTLAAIRDSGADSAATLRHERTDVPIPGSLRYSYRHAFPKVGPINAYCYVIVTGTSLTLQVMTSEDQEPPGFTAFVRSTRLLRPIPPTKPPKAAAGSRPGFGGPVGGYLVAWGVLFGIATLVNKRRKRVWPLPAGVATITIAVIWVLDVAFAIYLISAKNITDPYWQGRLVASPLVGGLVSVAVGVFLWKDAKKKLAPNDTP